MPFVLPFKLNSDTAIAPERQRKLDLGFDLYADDEATLIPGGTVLVTTSVSTALPPNVAGLILPRSGLAVKHGITLANAVGLVDPGYRGELKVGLHNQNPQGSLTFTVERGMRIAQLLLVPVVTPDTEIVTDLPTSDDGRGSDGFGSSGIRG